MTYHRTCKGRGKERECCRECHSPIQIESYSKIRLVKKTLLAITNQQTLDDEGLSTVRCEVEATLNSRSLITVSNDPHGLEALNDTHNL